MSQAQTTASTQEHLPIAGIVDDTVLMADGSLRAVLKVEPINFDLKSETEQNGIIYAYQGFLNSLDFPIQIVIQSKKLELEQYLIKLEQSQKNVTNDLLKIQIEDYVGFVRRLISVANIMSKRFYIIVSYAPVIKSAGISQFTNIFHKQATGPLMDEDEFKHYRAEVHNRANIISSGASRFGVKSQALDTQQLIELFYGVYNPDVVAEERLTSIDTLNAGVISSPDQLAGSEAEQGISVARNNAVQAADPDAPVNSSPLLEVPDATGIAPVPVPQAPVIPVADTFTSLANEPIEENPPVTAAPVTAPGAPGEVGSPSLSAPPPPPSTRTFQLPPESL